MPGPELDEAKALAPTRAAALRTPALRRAAGREIHTRPPLIDRSRLHRGDRQLWEILRRRRFAPGAELPPSFERRIEAARADYAAYLGRHPDRELWVYWRIAMLDDAARTIHASAQPEPNDGDAAPRPD